MNSERKTNPVGNFLGDIFGGPRDANGQRNVLRHLASSPGRGGFIGNLFQANNLRRGRNQYAADNLLDAQNRQAMIMAEGRPNRQAMIMAEGRPNPTTLSPVGIGRQVMSPIERTSYQTGFDSRLGEIGRAVMPNTQRVGGGLSAVSSLFNPVQIPRTELSPIERTSVNPIERPSLERSQIERSNRDAFERYFNRRPSTGGGHSGSNLASYYTQGF